MAKRVTLAELGKKVDKLVKLQQKLLKVQGQVLTEEKKVHKEEHEELEELEKLEAFEKEISKKVGPHPLRKITIRDIAKGGIGAFFGTAAHYTFIYGVEVAHEIDITRATLLYPITYAIGGIFLYLTGFRRIKSKKVFHFLPVRLTVLFTVALASSFILLAFFRPDFLSHPDQMYKELATVSLTAMIGACTADLIGRE